MIVDKLIERIKELENPTVVGLDPRLSYVPNFIKMEAFETFGKTPKGASEAFYRFNAMLMDELYDIVPAVKPQIAMYEQFGADGIEAYIKTIAYAKEKGFIVIGDIKRSDIASTAEAYADGHIGRVDVDGEAFEIYKEDFITLNPYLGFDSVEPYLKSCRKYERGLFILVKTSNPNSGEIQDLLCKDAPIHELVGGLVAKWGADMTGQYGFSEVGAVVGATHKEQAARLRALMPNTFFLVPGYGAQGGTADDLSVCFNCDGLGAIVNSSRGIIAAHQKNKDYDELNFAKAARQAAMLMKDDLNRARF